MSEVSVLSLRVAQMEREMAKVYNYFMEATHRAEKAEAEVARLREALKVAQAAMSAMQGGARTSDEIAGVLGLTPPAEQVKGPALTPERIEAAFAKGDV